jgi:hypothetical protein
MAHHRLPALPHSVLLYDMSFRFTWGAGRSKSCFFCSGPQSSIRAVNLRWWFEVVNRQIRWADEASAIIVLARARAGANRSPWRRCRYAPPHMAGGFRRGGRGNSAAALFSMFVALMGCLERPPCFPGYVLLLGCFGRRRARTLDAREGRNK